MSDEQSKLEEGPQREPSKVQKEGPNSFWKRRFLSILLPCLIYLFNGKKRYLLMSVIAVTLDPLFLYFPVLNDEKKCIHTDKTLGITTTVVRSFLDFLKLLHIISKLSHASNDEDFISELRHIFKKDEDMNGENKSRLPKFINFLQVKRRVLHENEALRECMLFLVDILAILPIPQVFVIFGIRGTKFSIGMTFFVIQYILRVIRTYFTFIEATGVSGALDDATWAIVAFYILLYMQGGHIFGALWYYYAIKKAADCWKKACINHTGCVHGSFICDDSLGDYNFVNDFCNINTRNTSSYNFGLYHDAFQSSIVEETDFLKKLIRCLKWGLQNLSAFGQNLQTSNDVGENIFAICMTITGVVLFVFLIGKMQSDTTNSEEINRRWRQIRQWSAFKDIPPSLRWTIRTEKRKSRQNKRAKLSSLLSDLRDITESQVKWHIGLKLLKNVKYFENRSENFFEDLCDCLRPAFFLKSSRPIRKGAPIESMFFVLEGKLLPTSWSSPNALEEAVGQELIDWALSNESESKLPVSTRTYEASTDVEAFTLAASDLKRVLSLHPARRRTVWGKFLRKKKK